MKKLISRRYYPYYHGKMSTHYSYRSWIVGDEVRKGSQDWLVGYVDDNTPNGWVIGPRGNPTRGLPDDLIVKTCVA